MIRVRNIKIPVLDDSDEFLLKKVSKKLNVSLSDIESFKINKKSIDARNKNDIYYVYELYLSIKDEDYFLIHNKNKDVDRFIETSYNFLPSGDKKLSFRPVIVGSGPAGLFCAYFLAHFGYKPLVIERGDMISERISKVDKFWKEGILDENSNVQFGEGGAGTFSDGKLNTLVKDKNNRMKKIFEIFVENGATSDILIMHNPHIGTDVLRNVVVNMRNKIVEMGGEFRFNTKLTDIVVFDGKIKEIVINDNEKIPCEVLVLAIGHSARDTFKMLYGNNLEMHSKPFAVGVRIIHDQELINKNQYGKYFKYLGAASYKLTYQTKDNRGVYSFCMCPGGYVVNSSSSEGMLVINGMSNYKRDSGFANSAIVVSINNNDFGNDVFSGMNFQEMIEKKAYSLGNGKIPIQKYEDYLRGKVSNINCFEAVKGKCFSMDINKIFPSFINDSLKEGIEYFDSKIKGFKTGIILAPETRTSSPIRFFRDESYMSNIRGIYPCGEGSGYAGGITTSAVDGIKVFESIARTYKKEDSK